MIPILKRRLERFKEIERRKEKEARTIQGGDLKIYIDDLGRVRLYFKEQELSKYRGLTLSILSDTVWHTPEDSKTKVEKISPEEMRLTRGLGDLPATQIWNFKISSDGHISWKIDISAEGPLRIDAAAARIFLSKAYSQWTISLKDGKFPEDFRGHDEEMVRINAGDDFTGCVSSREEVPAVTLRNAGEIPFNLTIHNSASEISSRVLEFWLEPEKEYYAPGSYPCLSAVIQLYPDREVLENNLKKIRFENSERIRLQEEAARKQQEEDRKRQEEAARKQKEEELRKQKEEDRKRQEEAARKQEEEESKRREREHVLWKEELHKRIEIEKSLREEQERIRREAECRIREAERKQQEEAARKQEAERKQQEEAARKQRAEELRKQQEAEREKHEENLKQQEEDERKRREREHILWKEELHKRIEIEKSLRKEEELNHQEAEHKRQEEERIRQEEERKRLEKERLLREEAELVLREKERRRRVREIGITEFYHELNSIISLKASQPDKRFFYVFGDHAGLHDRIASRAGDFAEVVSKINTAEKDSLNINIGISRLNFFRLNEIAQFYAGLLGRRVDLRPQTLNLFPVHNLAAHFIEYVQELNSRLSGHKIGFFLKDERLLELLWTVSEQADQYNERDILRLLGMICEHPFVGPQTLVLDTFHRCNTNCLHCWIHTPSRKTAAAGANFKMDLDLYKKLIDDAAGLLCDEIIIQGDGEPLLDPRFLEMIAIARGKGLKTLFFTNAILLDKEKAQRLIELEAEEIFCSLPAGTAETYARINPSQSAGTFNEIVSNLKSFISLRNASGRQKPRLQMTHVIHNLNCHELAEMSETDAYIGADKTRFYLARLDENIRALKLNPGHIKKMKEDLDGAAGFLREKNIELQDNIFFQLKNYNPDTGYWSDFLKTGCPVGWFFSLVLAQGEVSMCCHLRVTGDLRKQSFRDIWNSAEYNKFRIQAKYIAENKNTVFSNGVRLYDEFCSHCDTHQVILGVNSRLEKYNLSQFLKT